MDPLEISIAFIIVFIGGFIQTSIGFGLAIVSAPVLFYLNPHYVPAPITIAALTNCIFGSWHFRAHLSLKGLVSAAIARIPGSLAGAGLLMIASVQVLALMIAGVIALGMVISYARIRIPYNSVSLAFGGFLSGLMGTATSIGGPPMALVMQGQHADVIRGNLAAFFMFSCVTSLIILLPLGYLGWQQLILAAPLVPAAFLGAWTSSRLSQRINERWVAVGTFILCTGSVLAMLIQYWFRV